MKKHLPLLIIDSYADTEEKQITLTRCIKSFLPLQNDILLISHCPLPEHIISQVNYFIYDHLNFLLPKDSSPLVWFAEGEGTIHLYPKGNSFVVMRNLYLALSFGKSLGYKNCYFTEYDNILGKRMVYHFVRYILMLNSYIIKKWEFLLSNTMMISNMKQGSSLPILISS
jgi:hypothetical protein